MNKLEISSLSEEKVFSRLGTKKDWGLSEKEASLRLQKFGPNKILEEKKYKIILRFFAQFKELFAVILLVASLISFLAGARTDALVILGIVILNATIGFFQEYKADRATRALKKLLPSYAKVIREGQEKKILAWSLVPGDLIVLEAGDDIPADCRLIEEFELQTDNSTLTGETHPKNKTARPIFRKHAQIYDIPNLTFMGTNVASGIGKAVVINTGPKTEFGKIAHLTQQIELELSPLQIELARLAKVVSQIVIGVGVFGIFLGWSAGMNSMAIFLFALGVMVACVPEGLPATVSVALAVGTQRMAKRKALLKRLSAVETLGCTTVICTDKTGTLTKGEITVKEVWIPDKNFSVKGVGYELQGQFLEDGRPVSFRTLKVLEPIFQTSSFCNNAKLIIKKGKNSIDSLGDPTEVALLVLAKKGEFPYEKLLEKNKKVFELSFSEGRKRMTTIHRGKNGKDITYVKGAPESILECSTKIREASGRIRKITKEDKKRILEKNEEFASKAYRVLALAQREIESQSHFTIENTECDLTFTGLVAMMDLPREEVPKAVAETKKAGIKIIMITGDYGTTAKAIAKEVGIASDKTEVVNGAEINNLSDGKLTWKLKQKEIIFARVSPEHKMRIVNILKNQGEVVAVTGDGVNDAPALKAADIGVAMGITGTDVSKESADMILLDDSFATITAAIEEGRKIYDNIKKFNLYVFSSNVGELFSVIFGVIFRLPLPIIALQILSIDLGTDVLPSLALATEPPEEGVMERPPRLQKERLLNKNVLFHLSKIGLIMAGTAVLAFSYTLIRNGWHYGEMIGSLSPLYFKATTVTYATLVITQFANSFCCRGEKESLFRLGIFSNKYLLLAIALSSLMLLTIIYLPSAHKIWHSGPLSVFEWIMILGAALLLFTSEEGRKFILRKKEAPV